MTASAAVAPESVEQVQAIMRVCNEHRIPIFAFSTGKNLGYGGSAPIYKDSVVLDLKRMNRIIEVNDKKHYAIVEPGVTLFDLYRHIQEKGHRLSMEMMDPGLGQRHRQCLGPRLRPHHHLRARPLPRSVRHGGGAPHRGPAAHPARAPCQGRTCLRSSITASAPISTASSPNRTSAWSLKWASSCAQSMKPIAPAWSMCPSSRTCSGSSRWRPM